MPSNHIILCCSLLLLPSILPSIRVFSDELALCIRWPKYWSFSFNMRPSNEYPGLISFMDWLALLAVQGTLKSLLQHHSSETSILQCSAFCIVQLSHPYVTTAKTIVLTRGTVVGKVMSLHFFNLFFYWRIIALQNFVVFCQTLTWISHRYISPPFWTCLPSPYLSHPSRLIQSPCLSFLSHTANSCWLSILHMVM